MRPAATYFKEGALIRQVHGERAVGLGGPRALLMMAAHPVAFEGFFMSTGDLDDPYARLRRTADVLDAITFGPKARADTMCRHVRARHAQVTGVLPADAGRFPAGTPYAADDPELLLWILASLADSSQLAYERYVRTLSDAEREAYWQDFKIMGRLFGLKARDMPKTAVDFTDYMDRMLASGDLTVTDTARELGKRIVLRPPVPLAARPLVELVNQITVGLLPPDVRRQYRLGWDPLRAVAVAGGAEYIKRVLIPLLPGRVRSVPSAQAARALRAA
ncbi:hypothetical protein DSM112329_05268 [Paraconexibacter sp. AEG42_29]|uniref:ER-bound oxygenase mpaB/mpaB'/Rubber oxygenase catalytic domain-containing protein n=1 Tax=Paraconexibacter sp. AEG42_29 TaxID=2997339 RepID=A0AAU7B345_9ACTN